MQVQANASRVDDQLRPTHFGMSLKGSEFESTSQHSLPIESGAYCHGRNQRFDGIATHIRGIITRSVRGSKLTRPTLGPSSESLEECRMVVEHGRGWIHMQVFNKRAGIKYKV